MTKPVFRVPARSETNQTEQPQKMARGLTSCILKGEGATTKALMSCTVTVQCAADLRLCFSIGKMQVFS